MTAEEYNEYLALQWWFSVPRSMTKGNKERMKRFKALTVKALQCTR
jgi:hypothetical protein